ncbi:MAG TPA: multicopper oxidase [Vicinamibacterales bacterium]|nr:multicopper oxidase [Vicinamibacterales bacterium]
MPSRRRFLELSALAGGTILLSTRWGLPSLRAFGTSTLDPITIPKFVSPLTVVPAMPRTSGGGGIDYYEIAVRQFTQQILPSAFPPTPVWGYGSASDRNSFNYPGFTIESRWRTPVRVKWINDLVNRATGRFLPHLLPVDPTLHWANPPGGVQHRDHRPGFSSTPGPYTGPVPIVTHLHGIEVVGQESDGFPEAWYLPAANNIPSGFARTGTYYDIFRKSSPLGNQWSPGTAVFEYPNRQRATTLWYHDHTLGMTRVNVYAGPVGFYILRGGPDDQVTGTLPGPAPGANDPPGQKYYEIPIVIQDRSFNSDGSLFYPDSREFFDGFTGPYIPGSDISPIWNPEFFANTIVVNGQTWPFLRVEQRRYRFRFLNASGSRFLILRLSNGLPFWQIGSEGGFLPAPVRRTQLLIAPAERADVIVDFTGVPAGRDIILENIGPDEPFGGGTPGVDFPSADPNTTGQVMQLRVVPAVSVDRSTPPQQLVLPRISSIGPVRRTRQVSLNEVGSDVLPDVGPRAGLLGTLADGMGVTKMWEDQVTETPTAGVAEIWEIHNFTEDAHPIHLHTVQFQVLDREAFPSGVALTGHRHAGASQPHITSGADAGVRRPPDPWETGFKDTVIALPGEITRLKVQFDRAGLFVWHCHILEHEDNEMMRPLRVGS